MKSRGLGGMQKRRLLMLIILTAVSASFVTTLAYVNFEETSVYEVIEYPMQVYVDDIVGFNVETDNIHFGIVPPNGKSGREMTVTAGGFRTLVTMMASGEIAEWVAVSDNNFVLSPFENRTVMISVRIPPETKTHYYRNGTMRIIFRKV
jgi:hypothetical protein